MKILLTGSNGQLGNEFFKLKDLINYDFFFTDINSLDITEINQLNEYVYANKIDIIINCAAYTNVEKAEVEKDIALKVNSFGVKNLVKCVEKFKLKLIHYSTDYVYNGNNFDELNEESSIKPINFYGYSKREGEKHIELSKSKSIVIRTSWLYSKHGNNFVNNIIRKIKKNEKISVVDDQFGSPTYAKDLANDTLKIISSENSIAKNYKIYNYSNLGYTSWYQLAKKISDFYLIKSSITKIKSNQLKSNVSRPKFSIMDKKRIIDIFNLKINNWETSLKNYINFDLNENRNNI